MTRLQDTIVDAIRWVAFWVSFIGGALALWPVYVVRNFVALMRGGGYFPLGVYLILADQALKIWAVGALQPLLPGSVPLIEGMLELRYIQNYGAAFGILKGQTHLFVIMAGLTITIIVLYLSMVDQEEPLVRAALVLILAGAVGNLIDRVRLGYVIDYIHIFYYNAWDWPIFNLSDTIIDLGVGLILLDFVLDLFRRETQEAEVGA